MLPNLLLYAIWETPLFIELHADLVEVYADKEQEKLGDSNLVARTSAIKLHLSREDAISNVEMRILQLDPRQHPVVGQGDNILALMVIDMPKNRRQDVPSARNVIKAILNTHLFETHTDKI